MRKAILPVAIASALVVSGTLVVNHGFAQEKERPKAMSEAPYNWSETESVKSADLARINGTVSNGEMVRPQAASVSLISTEEAIAIAKKRVDGTVIEVELERDDGRYEYEVELKTKSGEAEVVIDAQSGNVLEVELDDDDDDDFDDDDDDDDNDFDDDDDDDGDD